MKVPEKYRITTGRYATTPDAGPNGAFRIPVGTRYLYVIASDGQETGWEHVSVNGSDRVPTWAEMCAIKGLFWDDEEAVLEYHPRKSQYINCHPYVLHLWRPTTIAIPEPPTDLIAPRTSQQAISETTGLLRGGR